MRRRTVLGLLTVGIALLDARPGPPAAAQQPPSPPVFRAEINFVEVPVIVTDERGAFVKDLKPEEFELYEDGRPQKIAAFALVEVPLELPSVPAGASGVVEPDVRTASPVFEGRLYVLLLDDLHTDFSRSHLVRQIARRFMERYFGTTDLAAVVYASGRVEAGQELTSSRKLLLAAIDRFQGQKLPSAGAEKLAIHLRQAADAAISGDEQQRIRTPEGLQQARSIRDPYDAERGERARRLLRAVENVATWLADVQGRRKALLLFSEGIDYDIYEPFNRGAASALVAEAQQAIAAAQRANVNIYAIDPRGLNYFGELVQIGSHSDYPQLEYGTFRGMLRELLLAQESLFALAEETGGLAIVNVGDVPGGLGRIVLDNSRYYLLGYYSDQTRWSRRFINIDVRVKRPGLNVRARRGYLPPDLQAAARARRADSKGDTSPALRAALSKPVPVGRLPLRVFAAPFKGSGPKASVLVVVELDGAALKFEPREGRYYERLEISIVAADHRAKVQGGDRQTFDLKLLPETHERVRRSGVRLLSRLELPPARYQIRVGAYEVNGGMTAVVPYDLEVPDYARAEFELSGVLLAFSGDALVTANQDPPTQDVLAGPPVAVRRFALGATLDCFAELYAAGSAGFHTVTLTATVRDGLDGRVLFEVREGREVDRATGLTVHPFRAKIPTSALKPGRYLLQISAVASTGDRTTVKELLFDVVAPERAAHRTWRDQTVCRMGG